MASGFGYFEGDAVALSTYNGVIVAAKVEQSVNTSARTVTVSVTAYVGYKRMAGGSWTISDNTRLWQTNHSDAYLSATAGDATNSVTKSFGAFSYGTQTVDTGTVLSVYWGQLKGTNTWSGVNYTNYVVSSKTYSYDSAGTAIRDTWSVRIHEYDSQYGWKDSSASGSFTTDSIAPSYTAPTGLAATWGSHTWNSVTGTVSITGYGTPSAASGRYIEFGACASSNTSYGPMYRCAMQTNSTSATMTVTNSSSGTLAIKGAMDYKIGAYATNTQLSTRRLYGTVYHTPPAPLQSITKTETQGTNYVSTVFTVTGGTSTNNTSATVATEIRISTDGGSTWSTGWTEIGTGTAWTAKTYTANIPYGGVSVKIQARQRYYGQYSEVKELSYASAAAVRPENPVVSVNSVTWNSASLSGSIDSYGRPGSLSGRKLNIGLADGNTGSPAGMEVQTAGATSATVTVNNSSTAVRGGLTLKGMMTVYPYTYANNTVANNIVYGSAVTLPPAPGQLSYFVDPNDMHLYTISYSGDVAKNITTYTQADLTRTVRYADSTDPTNWTYIVNGSSVPVGDVTTQQISLTAGHTYTVEAWMDYAGEQSEVSTVTFTVVSPAGKLYCSMGDQTERIEHLYGSVNGQTKKITKLYGSVNGVAKLIFED